MRLTSLSCILLLCKCVDSISKLYAFLADRHFFYVVVLLFLFLSAF